MPDIAVIGTRGGWSSEMLADTVGRITGRRLLVEMDRVRADLHEGTLWFEGIDLSGMDAVIIKKVGSRYSPDLLDRLELLRLLADRGIPVFSSPDRILRVIDRLSCTVTLRSNGIPVPPTTVTEEIDLAVEAVNSYGAAILKPLYTSKARGMLPVEAGPGLRDAIRRFKAENRIIYIQKRVRIEDQDLGIVFMGGEYLTTYARRRQNDAWHTTTRSGARYVPCDPPPSVIDLARQAQDLFALDFTCVDVALTESGPYVFEVSAFGGFRGIRETREIDPADVYVNYVLEKTGYSGNF